MSELQFLIAEFSCPNCGSVVRVHLPICVGGALAECSSCERTCSFHLQGVTDKWKPNPDPDEAL